MLRLSLERACSGSKKYCCSATFICTVERLLEATLRGEGGGVGGTWRMGKAEGETGMPQWKGENVELKEFPELSSEMDCSPLPSSKGPGCTKHICTQTHTILHSKRCWDMRVACYMWTTCTAQWGNLQVRYNTKF